MPVPKTQAKYHGALSPSMMQNKSTTKAIAKYTKIFSNPMGISFENGHLSLSQ